MQLTVCPICQGKWHSVFQQMPVSMDGAQVICGTCGRYSATRNAIDDYFNSAHGRLTDRLRAFISHLVFKEQKSTIVPKIDSYWIEKLREDPNFPTPEQQATNAIRIIGDQVNDTGEDWQSLPENFFVQIGSPNPSFAFSILKQLHSGGVITGILREVLGGPALVMGVSLSLRGWKA